MAPIISTILPSWFLLAIALLLLMQISLPGRLKEIHPFFVKQTISKHQLSNRQYLLWFLIVVLFRRHREPKGFLV